MFGEVGCILRHRLSLVWGKPEHQVAGQAKLPPENRVGRRHIGGLMGGCPIGKQEEVKPLVPIPLVIRNQLSQVFLDGLHVPLHHSVRLWV